MVDLEEVRRELAFLSGWEVIAFGSAVRGQAGPQSDIDIAIITRTQDADAHWRLRMDALSKAPERYDIQILEDLPIVVIADILDNYVVVFGDPPAIGEYLYTYRREWERYQRRFELPSLDEIKRGVGHSHGQVEDSERASPPRTGNLRLAPDPAGRVLRPWASSRGGRTPYFKTVKSLVQERMVSKWVKAGQHLTALSNDNTTRYQFARRP